MYRILVPQTGIELLPSAVKEQRLNHWKRGLILWAVRTMGHCPATRNWPLCHPWGLALLRLVSWGLRAQGCWVGSPEALTPMPFAT